MLLYTILGGFLAESASDFMQSIVMICALAIIVVISTVHAGGLGAVVENAREIPGFLEFFGIANPSLNEAGQQIVENGAPLFGAASDYGWLNIFSMLAWGLGYFGMPQVLLRFMAIRRERELKMSRRIAMVWVLDFSDCGCIYRYCGKGDFPDRTSERDGRGEYLCHAGGIFPASDSGGIL